MAWNTEVQREFDLSDLEHERTLREQAARYGVSEDQALLIADEGHEKGWDTAIDAHKTRINGTLDAKSYGDLHNRSWVFRTCGYGHGEEFWKPFVSMLRMKGYDGVISIEHEDSLMSPQEGFEKAVQFLSSVLIREPAGEASWF